MKTQFSLLKTRQFAPLFLTQFLGAFNDNLYKNALVILITYRAAQGTGGDPALLVTLAAGIFILPFFLFSATAGQLADRLEKTHIVRWVKIAEIIIMAIAGVGFALHHMPLLMLALFGMGAHSTFFGPLKYSILPVHLKPEELLAGNALVAAGTFVAILLGTIIGGLVILRGNGTEWITGLTVSCAVLGYLASRFIPLAPAMDAGLKTDWNPWRASAAIMGAVRRDPVIFRTILGISWFWLAGGTFLAQFPTYAREVLHGDETVVTLLLTCFVIGIAMGALLSNRLLKGEASRRYVKPALMGMASFTLLLCALSYLLPQASGEHYLNAWEWLSEAQNWLIFASLVGIAISGGIYIVPLYALLQKQSGEENRSRMIGANNIFNALFMVASAVFSMILLALGAGVLGILLAVALGNLFVVRFYKGQGTGVRDNQF
jgi:acyl-[acyl-carrier-protein]-phospholipid O-acyltransferase / long-chain-fatty-acid--[acyl-carrier-protein] ligase